MNIINYDTLNKVVYRMNNNKHKKKLEKIKIVYINIFNLIILLLMSEIILGNWLTRKPIVSKIPAAKYNVNMKIDVNSLYEREEKIDYIRDKNGYRSNKAKNSSKIVLTVGGSTTDERYVSEGETWTDQLEKLFKEKYNFVNGAVDGHSSYGHLYSLENWYSKTLEKEKIHSIIYYFGINDIRLLGEDFRLNDFDKITFRERIKPYFIKHTLYKNSFIYKKISDIKNIYSSSNSEKYKNNKKSKSIFQHKRFFNLSNKDTIISIPNKRNIENKKYSILIKKLIHKTHEYFPNSNIIFVQQQIPYCEYEENTFIKNSFDKGITICQKLFNAYETQKAVFKNYTNNKKSVIVLEMYKEKILTQDDMYDYIHTKPRGSKKIANYIFKNLIINEF